MSTRNVHAVGSRVTTRSTSRQAASVSPSRPVPVLRAASPCSEDGATRLYSDVAASRSPTPFGDTLPGGLATAPEDSVVDVARSKNEKKNFNSKISLPASDSEAEDRDINNTSGNDAGWTTVQSKRDKGAQKAVESNNAVKDPLEIIDEHLVAIYTSVRSLNEKDQSKISEKLRKILQSIESKEAPEMKEHTNSSVNESTRSSKKDRVLKDQQRPEHGSHRESTPSDRTATRAVQKEKKDVVRYSLPREFSPAAQINPNSYLGVALAKAAKIGGSKKKKSSKHRKSSLDSSSDSSGSESEATESSTPSSSSSSDSDSGTPHRRKCASKKNHSKKSKSRKHKEAESSNYKLPKPVTYRGQADLTAYHRFVRESTAFVEHGNFKRKDRIFILSRFLKDKAYDFYVQKVAINEHKWSLEKFFKELFDYCFPVDYRMQMRRKLENTVQGRSSVHEFAYQLEELFNLIGSYNERDKVIKLWDGLRASIRRELWRAHLNPEISSWKEVFDQAVIIEISENVAYTRNDRNFSFNSESEGNQSDGSHRDDGQGTENSFENSDSDASSSVSSYGKNNNYSTMNNASRSDQLLNTRRVNGNDYTGSKLRNSPHLSDDERVERSAGQNIRRQERSTHRNNIDESERRQASASGLASHNIDFNFDPSSESDRALDELQLGAISFGALNNSDTQDEPVIVVSAPFNDSLWRASHETDCTRCNAIFVLENSGERMEGGEYTQTFYSPHDELEAISSDIGWLFKLAVARDEHNNSRSDRTKMSPFDTLYFPISLSSSATSLLIHPLAFPLHSPHHIVSFASFCQLIGIYYFIDFNAFTTTSSARLLFDAFHELDFRAASTTTFYGHDLITARLADLHFLANRRYCQRLIITNRLIMPTYGVLALLHEILSSSRPHGALLSLNEHHITITFWLDDIIIHYHHHQYTIWLSKDLSYGLGMRVKMWKNI